MSFPSVQPHYDIEDDDGESYISDYEDDDSEEDNFFYEYSSDEEVLPDADDGSEPEHGEQFDDGSMHIFELHAGQLCSVACSPIDATLVAAGGRDHIGFIWKIDQDGACELEGHTETISSLAFSYDGQFLASGSYDGTVRVWDSFGNLKGALDGPGADGGIEWVRWHPREHKLLAFCLDSSVWMWDAVTFNHLNTFMGHEGGLTVCCGDFTPDGNLICAGSKAILRIWNVEGGGITHVVRSQPGHPYHDEEFKCLAINSTSTLALTGSEDGSNYLVNINAGRVVNTLPSRSESIECVGFAPSYSWAAVGAMDKKLIIWDIQHSLLRDSFDHEDGVSCLAWLGAWHVATACVDGSVRLWDSRSGGCVKKFKGHSLKKFKAHSECEETCKAQSVAIQSLSVSADQNFLVTASDDGNAIAYDMRMMSIF